MEELLQSIIGTRDKPTSSTANTRVFQPQLPTKICDSHKEVRLAILMIQTGLQWDLHHMRAHIKPERTRRFQAIRPAQQLKSPSS